MTGLRTAHIAEAQAELCSANVLSYLQSLQSGRQTTLKLYPDDIFHSHRAPLLACVSLGRAHSILVFNNVVLGGAVLGLLAALVKWIIERTKIAEVSPLDALTRTSILEIDLLLFQYLTLVCV